MSKPKHLRNKTWHLQVCRVVAALYRSPMRWQPEGNPYCNACKARIGWFDEAPHVRLCEHYQRWNKRYDRIVTVLTFGAMR